MRSSLGVAATPLAPTDEELVDAVARGDEEGLSQLYDRYAAAVYGLTLKIVGQPELAEELTQETFLRVWRRSSTFETRRGSFTSWLFGIAHNLAIDELRRRRARPQQVYDEPERSVLETIADAATPVEEEAWLAEQRRTIQGALALLPSEQREVLDLAYYGGLTQREIADRLGSPLGTIKTRARLGLLKLRALLQGQGMAVEE